jgi:hypothetical protein
METKHHRGGAHGLSRAGGDRRRCRGIVAFGQPRDVLADRWQRRLRQHVARCRGEDAVRPQQFARQIEAMARRVLGQITQDVGELHGAAELCRNA